MDDQGREGAGGSCKEKIRDLERRVKALTHVVEQIKPDEECSTLSRF